MLTESLQVLRSTGQRNPDPRGWSGKEPEDDKQVMQEKGLQEGENIPEGGNSPYSKVPSAWWQLWLSGPFKRVRGPSTHSPRPACPEVIRSDMNVPNLTPPRVCHHRGRRGNCMALWSQIITWALKTDSLTVHFGRTLPSCEPLGDPALGLSP